MGFPFTQSAFQSTHPVWGGTRSKCPRLQLYLFQSTHPVWGGTTCTPQLIWALVNFNPPTPCGVGLLSFDNKRRQAQISIHPPRVGWDATGQSQDRRTGRFQSTHPVWGGTHRQRIFYSVAMDFNPPTPCGVGLCWPRVPRFHPYFNPPTPCGVGRVCYSGSRKEV